MWDKKWVFVEFCLKFRLRSLDVLFVLKEGFLRCEHGNGDGAIAAGMLTYLSVASVKHSSNLGLL